VSICGNIQLLAVFCGMMPDESQLSVERRARLLERLQETGRLVTSDVAASSGVSVDTIRRDLAALEALGQARRVHGGAVLQSSLPRSFAGRAREAGAETGKLAQAVVDRLRPGQVIGLDAGTTGVEIARQIPLDLPLTVVTTSPPAAVALEHHRELRVVLVGGVLDLTWMAVTGADAVAAIASFRLDAVVLGACAVHPEIGVTTSSLTEVETKRAWIRAAAEVVLPVGSDKVDRVAPFVVCPLDEISVIVCSNQVPAPARRRYRESGVSLVSR
jgi:DeoR/GlpR family transcriptional regulator of sugar metabolism